MKINKRRFKGRLAQLAISVAMLVAFTAYMASTSNDWGLWQELTSLVVLLAIGTIGTITICFINDNI